MNKDKEQRNLTNKVFIFSYTICLTVFHTKTKYCYFYLYVTDISVTISLLENYNKT